MSLPLSRHPFPGPTSDPLPTAFVASGGGWTRLKQAATTCSSSDPRLPPGRLGPAGENPVSLHGGSHALWPWVNTQAKG